MLSIKDCKNYLREDFSDEQVEGLRDALYVLVNNIVDEYISSCDKI